VPHKKRISHGTITPVGRSREAVAGLKVSVDTVLFGALINQHQRETNAAQVPQPAPWRMADIGTGSGLLALMMMQGCERVHRCPVTTKVVALDINSDVCREATANVSASPWPTNIQVVNSPWQTYCAHQHRELHDGERFNLMVCNPPFYPRPPRVTWKAQLINRTQQIGVKGKMDPIATPLRHDTSLWEASEVWPHARAHARFNEYLPLDELFAGVVQTLAPDGVFWLLHAYDWEERAIMLAEAAGLCLQGITRVRFKEGKPYSRTILRFVRPPMQSQSTTERSTLNVPNDAPISKTSQCAVWNSDRIGCHHSFDYKTKVHDTLPSDVAVRGTDGNWTVQFTSLTQEYYLRDMAEWR